MGEVADVQAAQRDAPRERATGCLLFASRQMLLASTLAHLFVTAEEGWNVEVVDLDHPDLLGECQRLRANVVVLDVDSEVVPGIERGAHLAGALPDVAVLLLGDFDGPLTAEALHRGAKGVLTYAATPRELLEGVGVAGAGGTSVAAPALTGLVGGRPAVPVTKKAAQHSLSARELQILRRLAAGTSTAAIATELGISVQTVRKHTQHILGKLGVHSKLHAAAMAVREGLV